MKIQAIDHVSLYVRSTDRVKEFYRTVLAMTVTEGSNEDGNYLSVENESVHFFIVEDSTVTAEFIAKQHLSFVVDQLEPVKIALDKSDIPHETGTFEGFKFVNFHWCEWLDPEGIRLECVEHIH